jgi:hypothetical protein
MMNVVCEKDEKRNIDEKVILLALVGVFEALKNGGMTINESQAFMFSPYMVDVLKNKNCSEDVMEILKRGCELEDVELLLPEIFIEEIDKLESTTLNLLKRYCKYEETRWIKISD